MVPPTIGSHEEPIGVPESCTRTVGNEFKYDMSVDGGFPDSETLADGNINGAKSVGEGRISFSVAVRHPVLTGIANM